MTDDLTSVAGSGDILAETRYFQILGSRTMAADDDVGEPLATPLDAAQIVLPEGATVVRAAVMPGETVQLPFAGDSPILARLVDGNLAIKVGDVTVILEGYAAATNDPERPVLIETGDGRPLDIAALLAATDPDAEIETAAGPGGAGGAQGHDNTGAIFQPFGGGEDGLGGFTGAGGQGDTTGPGGAGASGDDGSVARVFAASNGESNQPPVIMNDISVSITEDQYYYALFDIGPLVIIQDPDSTSFTFQPNWTPLLGTAELSPDGHLTLGSAGQDLSAGEKLSHDLKFQVSDGQNLSNPGTIHVTMLGINDAPRIVDLSSLTYVENAKPTAIAPVALVHDPDSNDFSGGSLTVSLGASARAEDQISILNQGIGASEIGISGSDVTFEGVKFGTWSGGSNGTDLVIDFTTAMPQSGGAYQFLVEHIAYANSSVDPSAADRTVTFTLVDGDGTALGGADTTTESAIIHVVPINSAPVAVGDTVLTNDGANGIVLPEWALVANDLDPDGPSLGLIVNGKTDVGGPGPDSGFNLVVNLQAAMGPFYTSDGIDLSANQSGFVVTNVNTTTLTGSSGGEILIGSAGGEKLDGGGGNDIIIGAGGSDEYFGGAGDDTLVFGSAATIHGGTDGVAASGGLAATADNRGDVLAVQQSLVLTDPAVFGKIDGIETVSTQETVGASGTQKLTIDANAVQVLSDHTIVPGGVFAEHEAIKIDGDTVDQLYLSISKDGGQWSDTGVSLNGYEVYVHDTAAGTPGNSADAYVMVAAANAANVHLNQDAP
jgi:VCBS repeat-containing protein